MKTIYLVLLLSLSLLSQKHDTKPSSKTAVDADTVAIPQARKLYIDKYIKLHSKSMIVMVKVPGKKNLLLVKNGKWPDEIEETYNILKDASGKILLVSEAPFSESGDWDIECRHYFGDDGNTIAFTRKESIFTDDVKGGVVRETLLRYYANGFKPLKQVNELLDVHNKPIKADKRMLDFRDYKYSIYKNVSDCLSGYHIVLLK